MEKNYFMLVLLFMVISAVQSKCTRAESVAQNFNWKFTNSTVNLRVQNFGTATAGGVKVHVLRGM
jgi:hypothetical protein